MSKIEANVSGVQGISAKVVGDGIVATVSGVGPQGPSGTGTWEQVSGKPSTFPPSAHPHIIGDVTGLQAALDGKQPTGSYVLTTDASVTNAREWSAATVSQADAEAGTSTSRFAFTPLRIFQAIAAWWAASAAKAKLDGIAAGATANATDAQLRNRSTHTGTQLASTISDFAASAAAASPVQSVSGRTGSVTLAKADVGLGNVDNTSDLNKPISELTQAALSSKAASVHVHGNITSDGRIGTTAGLVVSTGVGGSLVASSSAALNVGNVYVYQGGAIYAEDGYFIIEDAGGATLSLRGDHIYLNVPISFDPGTDAGDDTRINIGAASATDSRLTNSREWSAATVTQAEAEAGTSESRRAFTPLRVFQAVAAWWAASAGKTKLDGIASGATANATDAQLRDRATHTGTQTASTISDFTTAVIAAAPPTTNASLLTSGTLPDARLSSNIARTSDVTAAVASVVNAAPASLDTLKELADALGNDASFAATVTNSLAAKAPIASPTFTGTVSGITKGMVGLGNVDNTSDANKPISTATQSALDGKAAYLSASEATPSAPGASHVAGARGLWDNPYQAFWIKASDGEVTIASADHKDSLRAEIGAAAATHSHVFYGEIQAAITDDPGTALTDLGAAAADHVHGNITTDGRISTASGQIVVTGSGGFLTTAATIGASSVSGLATVATSGSYADLSNVPSTFAPSAHTHAASEITSGTIATARLPVASLSQQGILRINTGQPFTISSGVLSFDSTQFVSSMDSRLTNARTPTVHGTTHGRLGTDPVYIDSIQVSTTGIALQGGTHNELNTFLASVNTLIGGLRTDVDGKAAASHAHITADVTGLQAALDGKAASSHSHIYFNDIAFALAEDPGSALANIGAAAADHTHGNITNAGAIGTTANRIVVTEAAGVLATATIGSGLTLSGGTLSASGGGGGSSVGSDLYLWSNFR